MARDMREIGLQSLPEGVELYMRRELRKPRSDIWSMPWQAWVVYDDHWQAVAQHIAKGRYSDDTMVIRQRGFRMVCFSDEAESERFGEWLWNYIPRDF